MKGYENQEMTPEMLAPTPPDTGNVDINTLLAFARTASDAGVSNSGTDTARILAETQKKEAEWLAANPPPPAA